MTCVVIFFFFIIGNGRYSEDTLFTQNISRLLAPKSPEVFRKSFIAIQGLEIRGFEWLYKCNIFKLHNHGFINMKKKM